MHAHTHTHEVKYEFKKNHILNHTLKALGKQDKNIQMKRISISEPQPMEWRDGKDAVTCQIYAAFPSKTYVD